MATMRTAEARKAPKGDRMVQVTIRFWTDKITEGEGNIIPGHAWGAGVLTLEANRSHGIESGLYEHFHSMLDLPRALEKLLTKGGISLHTSNRERKYRTS